MGGGGCDTTPVMGTFPCSRGSRLAITFDSTGQVLRSGQNLPGGGVQSSGPRKAPRKLPAGLGRAWGGGGAHTLSCCCFELSPHSAWAPPPSTWLLASRLQHPPLASLSAELGKSVPGTGRLLQGPAGAVLGLTGAGGGWGRPLGVSSGPQLGGDPVHHSPQGKESLGPGPAPRMGPTC